MVLVYANGFIHTVLNIPIADNQIKDGNHGQPISFEYLQKTNRMVIRH